MRRRLWMMSLVLGAAACRAGARDAAPSAAAPSAVAPPPSAAPARVTEQPEPSPSPPREWVAIRLQTFADGAALATSTGHGWRGDLRTIREWLEAHGEEVDPVALREARGYLDGLERELDAQGVREGSFAWERFDAVTRRELELAAGQWSVERALIAGIPPDEAVTELVRIARDEAAPEAWRALAALCLVQPSVAAACLGPLEECAAGSLDGGTGSCGVARDRARRRSEARHCSGSDLRSIALVPTPPRDDVPPVVAVDELAPGRSTLHLGGRPIVLTGHTWEVVVDGRQLGSASWESTAGVPVPSELVTRVRFDDLCRAR